MTTAHRPTWNPAKGGNEQGGFRLNVPSAKVSARDLPGHLTLKERGRGQGTAEELQTRDLKRELEEKEQRYRKRAKTDELELVQPSTTVDREPGEKEDDLDADVWLDDQEQQQQDEEEQDAQGDKIDEEASEDDDEEEDELLKELERIKREREEERRRKEEEERVKQENLEWERAVRGNPLLNVGESKPSFKVRRRWDDDVVFRKQNDNPVVEKEQGFINDTVRNEFHRKFLERYIK